MEIHLFLSRGERVNSRLGAVVTLEGEPRQQDGVIAEILFCQVVLSWWVFILLANFKIYNKWNRDESQS